MLPHDRRQAAMRNAAVMALVLAVAAFCATIVRNVTDSMTEIVHQPVVTADIGSPRR